ncbi:unnamed protein product [Arabis nemorensis]|uniref:RRM domain-containing protein n=1 Tax=Arabis nemorensis TaxID=586526 RepID=A0A565CK08_9BRAS|nr:unnamed protein product [Arabis nemorensis]
MDESTIRPALDKHFSSCGEVTEAFLLECQNKVVAYIEGEGAVEKALKLSGCECDVKECKIVAKKYIRPKIRQRVTGGSIVPDRYTKRANE